MQNVFPNIVMTISLIGINPSASMKNFNILGKRQKRSYKQSNCIYHHILLLNSILFFN
ncbi:hypothetical protein SAMN05660461_4331 [Chitinophaga ginsengisegetis]|uniref:Uncharacterized protein n=1 Tax=Chitinophaga ginsengisegetis TaxID=393003 RepID=A0A1T5P6X3_9BACT|nr:hypothetical protein SAMN05660461_4331 [Chitinophaga ginsengisegetis]